jgi:hypothetical protein
MGEQGSLNRVMVGYHHAVDVFPPAGCQQRFQAGEPVLRVERMAVKVYSEHGESRRGTIYCALSVIIWIFLFFHRFQEGDEQRVRAVGAGEELGMELCAKHEGVICQLGNLHQPPIRGNA